MADARFNRLVELFEQAATLPLAERRALLESLQGQDSLLRGELQQLLAGHEQAEGVLERRRELEPLLAAGDTKGRAEEGVGDSIGPYRLDEVLGEGGMGVVYRAHQEEPIRRDVALKLIRGGLDSREVVARFEAERQALARMDHPAIARVFDAGATATGRPYFVMELAAGSPITDYSDARRLSVARRLELFVVVCEAVQHAHRRGIIHRDLKPSNVLVAEVDGKPLPKVIDFGVAKAIDSGMTGQSLTTDRQLIGTPQYMSPEQWKASGDIDTRADVFSLGVLLYRLLVGALPFERGEGEGWGALMRTLALEETPHPSTRLRGLGERGEEVAAQRGTDLRALRRHLAGELDWIILRAMARNREERYGSAAELAEEVGRYLRNDALLVAPPGRLYHLRKAVRRHRGMLMAVAAVFLALVAGLVATSQALLEARRSRAAAEEQAAIAEAVNRFLNDDLLAAATPARSGDKERTVRQVLDQAAAKVEEGFDGPPTVEAEIRATLGHAYFALGEFLVAARMREAAYRLRRETLGPEDPDTLHSAFDLAATLRRAQRFDEAEILLDESLAVAERALGADHPLSLGGLTDLGHLLTDRGDLERATQVYREVLARCRRVHGDEAREVAVVLNNLASTLTDTGRYDEAIAHMRESLEIYRRVLGEDHVTVANVAGNLAGAYLGAERFAEAVPLLQETAIQLERIVGPGHAETLTTRLNLASAVGRIGDHDEAVRLAREVRAGLSRALGPNHGLSLAALRTLAVNLDRSGRSAEAESIFLEAVTAAREHLPAGHWYTGVFLSQYGRCLTRLERFAEAEAVLEEGWDILSAAFDEAHNQRREARENFVLLYERWGRPEEAARWREGGAQNER